MTGPGELRRALDFAQDLHRLGALRSEPEWRGACALARLVGLPTHHDPPKTWDTLKSVLGIVRNLDSEAAVLDAGSGARSAVLRCLRRLGYRRLHACDVRASGTWRYRTMGVAFSAQNLTKTSYADAMFDAVTSISVIEHGVAIEPFLREMARILRPGGLLFVSTDFWSEPIDCEGIYPYGPSMGQMKVFTKGELEEICGTASSIGLSLTGVPTWHADAPVIRWERVDREYTFAFLCFRRAARPV